MNPLRDLMDKNRGMVADLGLVIHYPCDRCRKMFSESDLHGIENDTDNQYCDDCIGWLEAQAEVRHDAQLQDDGVRRV